MLPSLRPLLGSLLGLASLAACSVEPPRSYNTVLHLDPRLADGSSSAVALAQTVRVLESSTMEGLAEGTCDWTLVEGQIKNINQTGAVRLTHARGPGAGKRVFGLTHDGEIDSRRVHAIDLSFRAATSSVARVVWALSDDPEAREYEETVRFAGQPTGQTVRIIPATNANWRGTIHRLRVEPTYGLQQLVDVAQIDLLQIGFQPGFEPLDGLGVAGAPPGDGGLVARGLDTVRAWPSDTGVALYESIDAVPDNATFAARVTGVDDGDPESAELVRFALDVREPGGTWERLHTEVVRRQDAAWAPMQVDLAPYAGRALELRLATLAPGEELQESTADGPGSRARGLWGMPRILGSERRAARPNVVLVTLDTLRGDHVGDASQTPRLRALAEEGIEFTNAWSACNATTPSHASILSGLYIIEHGAIDNRKAIPPEVTTMAESFRAAGYETAAAVSVGHIQAGTGFGQGFDRFLLAGADAHVDGRGTLDGVLDTLDQWSEEGPRPFFLWLHLFDPHTPYGPPEDFLDDYEDRDDVTVPSRGAEPRTVPWFKDQTPLDLAWIPDDMTNHEHVRHLYRAGVAYTDALMGELFDALDATGLGPNTALAITADHGEGLGEHGIYYGHAGLYPETLHVPLILSVPGGPGGVRIEEPVSTVDLAPTLLGLAELPAPPGTTGVDLVDVARSGAGDPERRVFFHYTRNVQVGLRDRHDHFVATRQNIYYPFERREVNGEVFWVVRQVQEGTTFLWDPEEDPTLSLDLAAGSPDRVEDLSKELQGWVQERRQRDAVERQVSPEEEARLKALGYGGGH